MAKIRVKTFRGYADFDSIRVAQQEAKNMILDIIVDGFPERFWWAQVYWYENQVLRTWSCPEVGLWSYTPWLHFELDLFDSYN